MQQLIAWESELLLWIQNNLRMEALTPVVKAVTHLGDKGIFWILLTLLLLAIPKTRKAGLCSLCALIGSALVNNVVLKNVVARTRPYEVIPGLELLVAKAHDFSFPSGHSAASFASATALYRTLPKKYSIWALLLAACIAFSRLYIGIHYPTDVLAGTLDGILLGYFSVPAVDRLTNLWKIHRKKVQ